MVHFFNETFEGEDSNLSLIIRQRITSILTLVNKQDPRKF